MTALGHPMLNNHSLSIAIIAYARTPVKDGPIEGPSGFSLTGKTSKAKQRTRHEINELNDT
jgi:hypothetical protein